MRKIYLAFLIFSLSVCSGQTALIDNLKKEIPKTTGKGRVDLLNYIAFHYFPISPDSGIHYCNMALELAKKIDYKVGIANVKLQMGMNYYYANKYKDALVNVMESLKLFEKINYPKGVGEAYSVFSHLYYDCGETEKAKDYAVMALNMFESNKVESFAKAYCYRILGYYNFIQKKYFEALNYYLITLDLMKKYGDGPAGLSYAYQEVGSTYIKLNDQDKAKKYFLKALECADSIRDANARAKIYIDYSQYFIKTGNYKTALDYLQKGLSGLKDLVAPAIKPKAYKYLVECYKKMGDFKNAFEAQLLLNKHENHFAGIQRKLQIEETQIKYETEKKENQIKLLKQEGEIERLWRNILITAILLLLSFALIILWFYRNKIKVNKELKIAQMEAVKANELKTELLGVVVHDLKNPLSVILGFANLAKDEIPEDSELEESLNFIESSSRSMLNLINKLLDSSAIETGKFQLECSPVNINEVIKKVYDEQSVVAIDKNQKLILNESEQSIFVNADFERLKQVIENLVSNAIKYSPKSEKIYINLSKNDKNAVLEVIDRGQGISDAEKHRVFGKFQKLSARPTGGEASSGLGLSIAKQLIELQNGQISFESTQGTGSTFRVTLPLI